MGYTGGSGQGKSGSFGTLMNLVKPFIGAGILAMPNAWAEGGLIASSVILLVLAYVAGWCIFRLVEASELIMKRDAMYNAKLRIARRIMAENGETDITVPIDNITYFEIVDSVTVDDLLPEDWAPITMPSFTDVGGAALGYWGRVLVDACIIITQFGACIAYIIFMSSNFADTIGLSTSAWIAILLLPLLMLSFIRQMDKLAPTSALGNIVYLFVVSSIFYIGFRDYCCVPFEKLQMSNPSYFPFVFGTCSFALEGIALVMPIKQRMANANNFPWVMTCAMCIVTTIYLTFSSLGYMFFGEETQSPVIDSLPKGTLTDVIKICLCVSLFFTFALQLFPVSTFFDEKIDAKLGIDLARDSKLNQDAAVDASQPVSIAPEGNEGDIDGEDSPETVPISPPTVADLYPHLVTKRTWFQNLVRTVAVLFVCAVGVVFPDFKLIVSLFGSFSNAMLAYIFPALFWIRVCSSSHLYGVDYYPFSRSGERLKHPLEVISEQNGQPAPARTRSDEDHPDSAYGANYGSVQKKRSVDVVVSPVEASGQSLMRSEALSPSSSPTTSGSALAGDDRHLALENPSSTLAIDSLRDDTPTSTRQQIPERPDVNRENDSPVQSPVRSLPSGVELVSLNGIGSESPSLSPLISRDPNGMSRQFEEMGSISEEDQIKNMPSLRSLMDSVEIIEGLEEKLETTIEEDNEYYGTQKPTVVDPNLFKASFWKKVWYLAFPLIVTVAGICASAVGVYSSIGDIVKHYRDN